MDLGRQFNCKAVAAMQSSVSYHACNTLLICLVFQLGCKRIVGRRAILSSAGNRGISYMFRHDMVRK